MEPSLLYGVFNLDQLSVIASRINHCYVLGSFHDYILFLSWFTSSNECQRAQIILRDYEPHYVCIDVWKNMDILHIFVCDSVPTCPVNWRKYTQHAINSKVLWFFNVDTIQMDDVSCKIFALMAAFRLSKMSAPELYGHLKFHSNLAEPRGVYLLNEYAMPIKLYRGCQSLKLLDKVYLKLGEAHLLAFVEKRLMNVIWDQDDTVCLKQQNRTVDRKLEKYRRFLQGKSFEPKSLGWYLPIRDIYLEKNHGMLSVISPIIFQNYPPMEAPYKQDADSWICYQARESDPLAKRDWYENMALLKKDQELASKHWLIAPIIKTCHERLVVSAPVSWWKTQLVLFRNVKELLSMGCVNLLSVGRILQLLDVYFTDN